MAQDSNLLSGQRNSIRLTESSRIVHYEIRFQWKRTWMAWNRISFVIMENGLTT